MLGNRYETKPTSDKMPRDIPWLLELGVYVTSVAAVLGVACVAHAASHPDQAPPALVETTTTLPPCTATAETSSPPAATGNLTFRIEQVPRR